MFTKDDNGVMMLNAVFFVQDKPPVQNELLVVQEQVEIDLIDFLDPFFWRGEGCS